MQSRRQSLIEVCTNTGVGMAGSWLITVVVMHLVPNPMSAATITVIACTVWSLVRGYWIRRKFATKEKQ